MKYWLLYLLPGIFFSCTNEPLDRAAIPLVKVDTVTSFTKNSIPIVGTDNWVDVNKAQKIGDHYWITVVISDQGEYRSTLQEIKADGTPGKEIDPFLINRYRGGVLGADFYDDKLWIVGSDRILEVDTSHLRISNQYLSQMPDHLAHMLPDRHRSFRMITDDTYLLALESINISTTTEQYYSESAEILCIYHKGKLQKELLGFPEILKAGVSYNPLLLLTQQSKKHFYVYRHPNNYLDKFNLQGKHLQKISFAELAIFEKNRQILPDHLKTDIMDPSLFRQLRQHLSEHLVSFQADEDKFQFIWKSYQGDQSILHQLSYDLTEKRKVYSNLGTYLIDADIIHCSSNDFTDTFTVISRDNNDNYFLIEKKINL